jgi:hypothetical protein
MKTVIRLEPSSGPPFVELINHLIVNQPVRLFTAPMSRKLLAGEAIKQLARARKLTVGVTQNKKAGRSPPLNSRVS